MCHRIAPTAISMIHVIGIYIRKILQYRITIIGIGTAGFLFQKPRFRVNRYEVAIDRLQTQGGEDYGSISSLKEYGLPVRTPRLRLGLLPIRNSNRPPASRSACVR